MAATGNGPQRSCGCWTLCGLCEQQIVAERDRAREELLPQVEKEKDAWVQNR